MPRSEVEAALEQVPPGTWVRLRMRDGSEEYAITGVENTLTLEDKQAADLEQVEQVLVDRSGTPTR